MLQESAMSATKSNSMLTCASLMNVTFRGIHTQHKLNQLFPSASKQLSKLFIDEVVNLELEFGSPSDPPIFMQTWKALQSQQSQPTVRVPMHLHKTQYILLMKCNRCDLLDMVLTYAAECGVHLGLIVNNASQLPSYEMVTLMYSHWNKHGSPYALAPFTSLACKIYRTEEQMGRLIDSVENGHMQIRDMDYHDEFPSGYFGWFGGLRNENVAEDNTWRLLLAVENPSDEYLQRVAKFIVTNKTESTRIYDLIDGMYLKLGNEHATRLFKDAMTKQ